MHPRQLIFKERQALRAQLRETTQPPVALLLACLLLFQQVHKGALLQAPGKLVPALLAHYRDGHLLPEASLASLTTLQAAVIDHARGMERDQAEVASLIEAVRQLVLADSRGSADADAIG